MAWISCWTLHFFYHSIIGSRFVVTNFYLDLLLSSYSCSFLSCTTQLIQKHPFQFIPYSIFSQFSHFASNEASLSASSFQISCRGTNPKNHLHWNNWNSKISKATNVGTNHFLQRAIFVPTTSLIFDSKLGIFAQFPFLRQHPSANLCFLKISHLIVI